MSNEKTLPPAPAGDALSAEIAAHIGCATMKFGDFVRLAQGGVLALDQKADALIDVTANGKRIGTGRAVLSGERVGVAIIADQR